MTTLNGYEFDDNYELIRFIAETWGSDLESMSEDDTYYLIANVANELCKKDDCEITENAREVVKRLKEFTEAQLATLLQALNDY